MRIFKALSPSSCRSNIPMPTLDKWSTEGRSWCIACHYGTWKHPLRRPELTFDYSQNLHDFVFGLPTVCARREIAEDLQSRFKGLDLYPLTISPKHIGAKTAARLEERYVGICCPHLTPACSLVHRRP
jgi:hypothetical protein